MQIRNPLRLRYPLVDLDETNLKASIDAFLKLLISTNKYDCLADNDFGFCLENFRYEAFSSEMAQFLPPERKQSSENENSQLQGINDPLYERNLIGNSKNANTFARELKQSIERYEKRLRDVSVDMNFQKNARIIHVIVTGKMLNATNTEYYNEFDIEVW